MTVIIILCKDTKKKLNQENKHKRIKEWEAYNYYNFLFNNKNNNINFHTIVLCLG